MYYQRYAGQAAFVSNGFYSYWWNDYWGSGAGGWVDLSWASANGQYVPFGSNVTMNVSIVDANGQIFQATPVVPIVATSNNSSSPYACSSGSWYCWDGSCSGSEEYCAAYTLDQSWTSGTATGVTQ